MSVTDFSAPPTRLGPKANAAAGVQEYWAMDRFRREMTVFRGMQDEVGIAEGDVYQTPLRPGFELALGELLARADRYESVDD